MGEDGGDRGDGGAGEDGGEISNTLTVKVSLRKSDRVDASDIVQVGHTIFLHARLQAGRSVL